jgi:hypothetical protein
VLVAREGYDHTIAAVVGHVAGDERGGQTLVLSFAAINAQLFYAAPSHLVCTISGYRQ